MPVTSRRRVFEKAFEEEKNDTHAHAHASQLLVCDGIEGFNFVEKSSFFVQKLRDVKTTDTKMLELHLCRMCLFFFSYILSHVHWFVPLPHPSQRGKKCKLCRTYIYKIRENTKCQAYRIPGTVFIHGNWHIVRKLQQYSMFIPRNQPGGFMYIWYQVKYFWVLLF